MRLAIALFFVAFTVACACEAPDVWKGAELTGCSGAGSVECCSYDDGRCMYVVCNDGAGFCSYEQSNWSCF